MLASSAFRRIVHTVDSVIRYRAELHIGRDLEVHGLKEVKSQSKLSPADVGENRNGWRNFRGSQNSRQINQMLLTAVDVCVRGVSLRVTSWFYLKMSVA